MAILLNILNCMLYITWSEKLEYTSADGCSDPHASALASNRNALGIVKTTVEFSRNTGKYY